MLPVVLFLCDIAFKALLTTQMSMFLFNQILGEKTHIKRFELSEKKRKEKKTLESDSSSQLLNNWAHTQYTNTGICNHDFTDELYRLCMAFVLLLP